PAVHRLGRARADDAAEVPPGRDLDGVRETHHGARCVEAPILDLVADPELAGPVDAVADDVTRLLQHAGRLPAGDLRDAAEVLDALGDEALLAFAAALALDRLEAPAPHLAALAQRTGAVASVRRDLRRVLEESGRADADLDGHRAA